MLYANTRCAKVVEGAVVATGRFAALIAPTSPLSGGVPEEDAKANFGVYPQQNHAATDTHRVVAAEPWYDAGTDAVYSTTLEAKTLAERKAELKQSVNRERDRRWPGTVNCDLAGDGSLVIPADARNDTDLRNIQAVTTTAQVVAGTPNAVLKFRDANDVTHNLSPEEVITLGLIVQAHVQSFYEKAWTLKDSIDSMTSVELDQLDVTSNTHWE